MKTNHLALPDAPRRTAFFGTPALTFAPAAGRGCMPSRKSNRMNLRLYRSIGLMLLAATLIFALAAPLRADSYYSSIGLGLPKYLVSAKAQGMGGAGIGVADRMSLNNLNPAAINIYGMTTLGVNLEYEYVDNKSEIGSATTRYGNAMGMQFIVPVKSNITLITMLRPLTGSRYTLSFASADTSLDYTRTLKGNGGISSAAAGLQYRYKSSFAVAALVNLNFGAFNEKWKTEFVDAEYRDGTDEFNSHLYGFGYDLSAQWKVNNLLSVGGVYRSGSTLNMETGISLSNGTSIDADSNKIDVDYPAAFGLGMALTLKKWLFAADYYNQSWDKYSLQGRSDANLKPFRRFSAGIEFLDAKTHLERYRRRIAYRIGGYYSQLPFTNEKGENVHEAFLSLGFGLPFPVTVGQVDLAFEVGKRGDVSRFMYQDTIFRLSASLVGSERWFERRY